MPKDWAAMIVGVVLMIYWARVLRLVRKTRRKTGQNANFLPPEPLGRLLRIVWYPTVVVWIMHPLLVAFWDDPAMPLRPVIRNPVLSWTGAIVAIAALAATWVCWRRMGKSWRMGINPGEATPLVVTGPFAHVRHPIYALSSLLMLATLAAVPSPVMLIVATVHLLFLQWEARREERYLTDVHGATYTDYVATTGRFLPRFVR